MDFSKPESAGRFTAEALFDDEKFARAVNSLFDRIYLVALAATRDHEMAEDIAQETFLRAWVKRGLVHDRAMLLEPWLVRIARNLATDWLRRGQQRSRVLPLVPLEELTMQPPDTNQPSPRDAAMRSEDNARLAAAVMAMPDDLRETIILHYAEGMTASDIARMLGEAPSTVTRRLERAHARLRVHMESGLATGLATIKPGRASAQKVLALTTAVGTLPATSRAQLVRLLSDTPPPPVIDPVTTAAQAGAIKETGIMKSMIAKSAAGKLAAAVAAVAIIGSGVYAVNNLAERGDDAQRATPDSGAPVAVHGVGTGSVTVRSNANPGDKPRVSRGSNGGAAALTAEERRARYEEKKKRIALLQNDLISTHPLVVTADGETSGQLHFTLQVVNDNGMPIKDATVTIPQYGWSTNKFNGFMEPPKEKLAAFKTDHEGRARVEIPEKLADTVSTNMITAEATHPDYARTRATMDLTSVTKLVMQSGFRLAVKPVDARTSEPIRDSVRPVVVASGGIGLSEPDFFRQPDGTIVINKITEENLHFHLAAKDADGRAMLSAGHEVHFPLETDQPKLIALNSALTLTGRLSPNVPRPVRDIKVTTSYFHHKTEHGPGWRSSTREIDVAEDGTFEIPDVPGNSWVSVSARGGGYFSGVTQDDVFKPNLEFTAEKHTDSFDLPMHKCATIRVTLQDESGRPVPGVTVHYRPVYGENQSPWPAPRHGVVTNAEGMATFEDVPAAPKISLAVVREWEIINTPGDDDDTRMYVEPGQVADKTLTVKSVPTPEPATGTIYAPDGYSIIYEMQPGTYFN